MSENGFRIIEIKMIQDVFFFRYKILFLFQFFWFDHSQIHRIPVEFSCFYVVFFSVSSKNILTKKKHRLQ